MFNSCGELCGLACDSLPSTAPNEREVSWHVLLWPMLATILDYRPVGPQSGVRYPAIDLATDGTIICDGVELVKLTWDGGCRTTISLAEIVYRRDPSGKFVARR